MVTLEPELVCLIKMIGFTDSVELDTGWGFAIQPVSNVITIKI